MNLLALMEGLDCPDTSVSTVLYHELVQCCDSPSKWLWQQARREAMPHTYANSYIRICEYMEICCTVHQIRLPQPLPQKVCQHFGHLSGS